MAFHTQHQRFFDCITPALCLRANLWHQLTGLAAGRMVFQSVGVADSLRPWHVVRDGSVRADTKNGSITDLTDSIGSVSHIELDCSVELASRDTRQIHSAANAIKPDIPNR